VVIVGDEAHVVGVDCAEGGQAVADDGEEGDEDIVDYVDYVVVATANVDPAYLSNISTVVQTEHQSWGGNLPIRKSTQIRPKSVINVA
jgi:hypothetical protein